MTPQEPRHGLGRTADHFAAYLDFYREEIIAGVLALSDEDRRTPRVHSGWTPIELLSHVLHMEQRWFVWGFLGEQVADPWGDWTTDEPWDDDADPDKRWFVADEVTAEELAERLQGIGRRTTVVLRDHPLEETAAEGERFDGDPADLQWICFHVLQEYARHAGHLDIVVELGV
jgi:uncharacterized damage-inducible protein DinB